MHFGGISQCWRIVGQAKLSMAWPLVLTYCSYLYLTAAKCPLTGTPPILLACWDVKFLLEMSKLSTSSWRSLLFCLISGHRGAPVFESHAKADVLRLERPIAKTSAMVTQVWSLFSIFLGFFSVKNLTSSFTSWTTYLKRKKDAPSLVSNTGTLCVLVTEYRRLC